MYIYCFDIIVWNVLGWTPLHAAAANGSTNVLNTLLDVPTSDINVQVIIVHVFDYLDFFTLHTCTCK